VIVALVDHSRRAPAVHDLAASLGDLGHEVAVISPPATPLDGLLRRRGFATPLTHIPLTLQALLRGDYELAHAFSPQAAYAALLWRRLRGGRAVFSLVEPIERERLSDRRLRLRLLSTALGESDAVIVHDEDTRAAAWRWLSLEPRLIPPTDGTELERVYRGLLAQT
jgi:Glycosyltransferase Family 4